MAAAVGSVAATRSGTAASLINVARMAGATLGVATLGTAFRACGGGAAGVGCALAIGGLLQLAAATRAWHLLASAVSAAPGAPPEPR